MIDTYRGYLVDNVPSIDEETEVFYNDLVKIGRGDRHLLKDWEARIRERQHKGLSVIFDGRDLSQLNLSHIYLGGISFIGANLNGTDLTWADVSGTNLSLANLKDAILHMISTRGTFAIGADFTNADLSAGRMRESLYARAIFSKAKIEYTDFKRAVF